jgi:hypothetical protein
MNDNAQRCGERHPDLSAWCELPAGHKENHFGHFPHGTVQWPHAGAAEPAVETCDVRAGEMSCALPKGHEGPHATAETLQKAEAGAEITAVDVANLPSFRSLWEDYKTRLLNGRPIPLEQEQLLYRTFISGALGTFEAVITAMGALSAEQGDEYLARLEGEKGQIAQAARRRLERRVQPVRGMGGVFGRKH